MYVFCSLCEIHLLAKTRVSEFSWWWWWAQHSKCWVCWKVEWNVVNRSSHKMTAGGTINLSILLYTHTHKHTQKHTLLLPNHIREC